MSHFSLPTAITPSLYSPSHPVTEALEFLALAGIEARGAIFTRPEVVDFILDLTGYTPDKPLHRQRFLEPAFGKGDFLLPAVDRLIAAWKKHGGSADADAVASLAGSIRAVELHRATFIETKEKVILLLMNNGIAPSAASSLAAAWLVYGDFLLADLETPFDFAAGNPPYVRQELIPDALLAEYRARYKTMYDRADLYIPFIERSLLSLTPGGHLGFICADRWTKNKYGGPLRRLVSENFHLKTYVDMVDTAAFQTDVIAYPAITVIAREKAGATRTAHRPLIDKETLSRLADQLRTAPVSAAQDIREFEAVTSGAEPWILESRDQLALVRRLEGAFPTIEKAGCKVGIGVATGADDAFIAPFDEIDVEPDRKLPLVMTRDILTGTVQWRGYGIVNPFSSDGGLVPLKDFPRLKQYLESRKAIISRRHCAQKAPANWYRTIDRIHAPLLTCRKLLIPDIKGHAQVVFEDGHLYPHHNLYFITSEEWDLRALQAVLLSGIARFFVSIYSTRMRGGYLRFQAQYLRRIRVPQWRDVPAPLRQQLIRAAELRDEGACNRAAFALYGLTPTERAALGGNGD